MVIGVKELARMLGVSRVTIYSYIGKGMPCHRISEKKLAFDYEEVVTWIKTDFKDK